jgi:hypothetical protein
MWILSRRAPRRAGRIEKRDFEGVISKQPEKTETLPAETMSELAHAAVDAQLDAGDKAAFIRIEKQRRGRPFRWADPSD